MRKRAARPRRPRVRDRRFDYPRPRRRSCVERRSPCHRRHHSFWYNNPFSPNRRSNGNSMPILRRDYPHHRRLSWPATISNPAACAPISVAARCTTGPHPPPASRPTSSSSNGTHWWICTWWISVPPVEPWWVQLHASACVRARHAESCPGTAEGIQAEHPRSSITDEVARPYAESELCAAPGCGSWTQRGASPSARRVPRH